MISVFHNRLAIMLACLMASVQCGGALWHVGCEHDHWVVAEHSHGTHEHSGCSHHGSCGASHRPTEEQNQSAPGFHRLDHSHAAAVDCAACRFYAGFGATFSSDAPVIEALHSHEIAIQTDSDRCIAFISGYLSRGPPQNAA